MFFNLDKAFISVYHLLQINIMPGYVGKGVRFIKMLIKFQRFGLGKAALCVHGCDNAACKTAPVGNKINSPAFVRRIEIWLQLV